MPRRATRADVLAAAAALPPRTAWVGVDGLGGAGKSSLAAAIAAAVPRTVVVPTDDLQGPGIAEWDWPRLAEQVVAPLLAGRPGGYDVWRWGDPAAHGRRTVPVGALVVVEGVSAIRSELALPWDLTVWVEAAEQVRRARLAARDGPELDEVWRRDWWPSEAAYLARDDPQRRADLVVDGTR